eukprot:scaffold271_cov336-Pavlova_lutheri.AAC.54
MGLVLCIQWYYGALFQAQAEPLIPEIGNEPRWKRRLLSLSCIECTCSRMNLFPIAEVPTSQDEESRLTSYESNRVAKVDHIRYVL